LAAAVATVVALNATRPVALVLGLSVATLLSFTGFVVKRFITERPLVIAPLVEAGPALALLQSYFYWRSGHAALPPLAILSTVGLFWTYYEIWNFARRLSAAALPYELTQDRLRVLLVTLLALAVGWSLGWLFLAGATWLRGSQNVQTLGILVMMLLQFASSAFVPVKALPGYIQAVAKVNPLSYGINAARDLVLGRPPGTGLVVALLVSAAVAVVGSGLAVAGFSRR